jgi:hypothetical protein
MTTILKEIPDNKFTRYQFNAYLGHYLSFANYFGSYERAFEALMEKVYQSGNHVDLLAYPILFMARHCMELGFKTNIRYFLKYSEKDDFKKGGTHDLEKLFGAFKFHIAESINNLKSKYGIEVEKVDIEEFNKYCEEVNKLTNIFQLLDKKSDSFRYPVDKDNNNSFDQNETINLLDVRDLYHKTSILLTHTADVFRKYTDYADKIENMYEQEMRNFYDY